MAKIDDIIYELQDALRREGEMLNFERLQSEVGNWSARNFGAEAPLNSVKNVLGMVEEAGELVEEAPENAVLMIALGRLSHHHLKELQAIRGSADVHQEKIKDAIGDIIIYLSDYCFYRNFNMQEIVESVWGRVKQRDWKKNAQHGGDVASADELAARERDRDNPLSVHYRPYLTQAQEVDAINKTQRERAIMFGIDPSDAEPPTALDNLSPSLPHDGVPIGIDIAQPPTPEEEAAMLEDERRAKLAEERGEVIPF